MFFSSCGWDSAKFLIFSHNVFENLIYYSHFFSAIPALSIGLLVFIKDRKSLVSKLLFFNTILFSVWVYFDLILWATEKPDYTMFFWSLIVLVEILIYGTSLYFIQVFIDEKDISFIKKIIILLIISPVIVLLFTRYNLINFDFTNCDRGATEGMIATYYTYFVEILFTGWIILFAILRYRKSEKEKKRRIFLVTMGIFFFLFLFSLGNIVGSFTEDWRIPHYGLFGMPIFVGFLAYLIVKYKVFNVKLIASQALIIGLVIGIGAQFFFIQNTTNQILTGITLAIAIIFGYQLVRSVKLEVERKEELEKLSTQLAGANDQLHQLDKAKSEFISIASHQLRTPLTAIKGFVSLLLEGTYGQVPETQKAALEKVYISNERLVQLVEDLLNISRIESGRMEFDFQDGQIEDLVTEAVNTLDLSAKNKGLYLGWKKPAQLFPKIKIDITKVKEVVSNMIDNSIKYTQKGGVTVRTEKGSFFDHDTMEQKNIVRVIVSDTGIGMDKEDIENIFNKFVRGKEISHYHTDGTGLGMFIAKKVAEAHQGKIWAESAGKGMGSRFILELPAN
jgi:signal transduction histidine kinase